MFETVPMHSITKALNVSFRSTEHQTPISGVIYSQLLWIQQNFLYEWPISV